MLFNNVVRINGKSLYVISRSTDIPYMTLNNIVSGETELSKVSSGTLYKICRLFNISLDSLMNYYENRNNVSIPKNLSIYFWDSDINKLSVKTNKDFIISRLLTKGGTEGYRFIIETYTPYEIKDTIKRTRNLTPVTAAYFMRRYHLKKEDMMYYRMNADKGWR